MTFREIIADSIALKSYYEILHKIERSEPLLTAAKEKWAAKLIFQQVLRNLISWRRRKLATGRGGGTESEDETREEEKQPPEEVFDLREFEQRDLLARRRDLNRRSEVRGPEGRARGFTDHLGASVTRRRGFFHAEQETPNSRSLVSYGQSLRDGSITVTSPPLKRLHVMDSRTEGRDLKKHCPRWQ